VRPGAHSRRGPAATIGAGGCVALRRAALGFRRRALPCAAVPRGTARFCDRKPTLCRVFPSAGPRRETRESLEGAAARQREEFEATVKRHLAFADELLADKQRLTAKVDGEGARTRRGLAVPH